MAISPHAASAFPSVTASDVASQPQAWSQAAALGAGADVFTRPGRTAILGCGSSWFVAAAIAVLREDAGAGETDAFAASEARLDRSYDRVVVISRSGVTTELIRALRALPPDTETVALVGEPSSPVGEACDASIVLGFATEASVVQTRFVTSTLVFARAALGADPGPIVRDGEVALGADLPLDPTAFTHHVFLGTGWRCGVAASAALVIRESAGAWTEAHPAMEYRHGPMAAAGPSTAVWLVGPAPDGLAAEIAATGATVVAPALDPLAVLVQAQRAALALADARGLDVDRPPNLSRAVVLEP